MLSVNRCACVHVWVRMCKREAYVCLGFLRVPSLEWPGLLLRIAAWVDGPSLGGLFPLHPCAAAVVVVVKFDHYSRCCCAWVWGGREFLWGPAYLLGDLE